MNLEEISFHGKTLYRDDISRELDGKYDLSKIERFFCTFGVCEVEQRLGLFVTIGTRAGCIVGLTTKVYNQIVAEEIPSYDGMMRVSLDSLIPNYVKAGYLRAAKLRDETNAYFLTEDSIKVFLREMR